MNLKLLWSTLAKKNQHEIQELYYTYVCSFGLCDLNRVLTNRVLTPAYAIKAPDRSSHWQWPHHLPCPPPTNAEKVCFLPPAVLLRLKMALSAVKSVSRSNTSGGRGGSVNHLAWVPRQVSQGLLWTTLAERVWINWGVLKEFAWKRWQPWQPGWTGACSCITPMCVQANEDTERGSVCSCPHYTSVCLDVTKDQNCISTVHRCH